MYDLKSLSTEDKQNLIDYLVGMPDDVAFGIKTHLKDWDKELHAGKMRYLSPYSSIGKLLGRDNLTQCGSRDSTYQREYCTIFEVLEKNQYKLKDYMPRLNGIISMPCYDNDGIIQLEVAVADLLKQAQTNNLYIGLVTKLLNQYILPYKFKVYDLYSHLFIKDTLGIKSTTPGLSYINSVIMNYPLMLDQSTNQNHYKYSDTTLMYDMASWIHLYFNLIGASADYKSAGLLLRFKNQIYDCCNTNIEEADECYSILENRLDELITTGVQPIDEIGRLLTTGSTKDHSSIDPDRGREIMQFLFYKSDEPDDFIAEEMIDKIKRLTSNNEIVRYIYDDSYTGPEKSYTYELTPNDYGNIINTDGATLAIAYDKYTHEIYSMILYKGDYYIAVKKYPGDSILKAVCLSTENDALDRKVLSIKPSSEYYYQWVTTIG